MTIIISPALCNKRGFTLLELLLVIAVISGILLLSINRYNQYQKTMTVATIKADIANCFQALNLYYHSQICVNGIFPTINQDLLPVLSGQYLSTPLIQSSLIDHYQALIVDSGQKTTDNRPVYQLMVKAYFVNDANLSIYQASLGALINVNDPSLYWSMGVNASVASTRTPLWILTGSLANFKQLQTFDSQNCE